MTFRLRLSFADNVAQGGLRFFMTNLLRPRPYVVTYRVFINILGSICKLRFLRELARHASNRAALPFAR